MKKKLIPLFAAVLTATCLSPWETSSHVEASEQPTLQMAVMSDVHINQGYPNNKFKQALTDLKNIAPGYDTIAVVGDFTDRGFEEDYKAFKQILGENKNPGAEQFITMGNHEYFESNYDKASTVTDEMMQKRFMDYNGDPLSTIYFDKWIKGYHFISLAGELSAKTLSLAYGNIPDAKDWAYISEEQYQWFERTLAVEAASNKPIFVFLHQPIANTVYGSDKWNAGFDSKRLLTILKKYPQAILFSGHSHYPLNHPKSIYQDGFTMVNTSSVEYTWNENGRIPGFSQGYLVNVYDDRVEMKSREFSDGTWIKSTTIPIPYKEAAKDTVKPTFTANSNLRISNLGTTTVTLSWDQGQDNTAIDRYVIKESGKTIQTVYSQYWKPEEAVSATINNLVPHTSYTYEIYALDAWDNLSADPIKINLTTQGPKGWDQKGDTWYYYTNEGAKQTGWLFDKNRWYYFDQAGVLQTGWISINGKWYYLQKSGEMMTGWFKDGTVWYYLNQNGAMQTGWIFLGNKWYFLDSHGIMKIGWLQNKNTWYYLDNNGAMYKGWLAQGSQWYYLKPDGAMVNNKYYISGKWYYFSTSGIWRK
ncbi:metallophosphoesterase [Neobacillus sp.]|uniref:metallophosphoesterase n=1 Tax=Neobacillus sp. TaxID=2675273 RepID=UPI00289D9BAE|nr:metallophosphoesterase [Neobacillus sp.]